MSSWYSWLRHLTQRLLHPSHTGSVGEAKVHRIFRRLHSQQLCVPFRIFLRLGAESWPLPLSLLAGIAVVIALPDIPKRCLPQYFFLGGRRWESVMNWRNTHYPWRRIFQPPRQRDKSPWRWCQYLHVFKPVRPRRNKCPSLVGLGGEISCCSADSVCKQWFDRGGMVAPLWLGPWSQSTPGEISNPSMSLRVSQTIEKSLARGDYGHYKH